MTFLRRCMPVLQNKTTPLGKLLMQEIREKGRMSFSRFMDRAMRDPDHGYFTTKSKVIGSDADFVTAPELLPEFGWSLARWVVQASQKVVSHRPELAGRPITLVELGPGTGRLMAQMLMYFKHEVGEKFLSDLTVHMVEVSPVMVAQQQKLTEGTAPLLRGLSWGSTLQDLLSQEGDGGPVFIVSNEYLDVLPVHVLRCRGSGEWVEETVGFEEGDDGAVGFTLSSEGSGPAEVADLLIGGRREKGVAGDRWEVSPQAVSDMVDIASVVAKRGGMALAIDYGRDAPSVNTLQGMYRQVTCSPLLSPGEVDISWHVDFDLIRDHISSSVPSVSVTSAHPQCNFLEAMGFNLLLQQRLRQQEALPPHLEERCKLLMDPNQMGGWHRAVAICDKAIYPPPGFEPRDY